MRWATFQQLLKLGYGYMVAHYSILPTFVICSKFSKIDVKRTQKEALTHPYGPFSSESRFNYPLPGLGTMTCQLCFGWVSSSVDVFLALLHTGNFHLAHPAPRSLPPDWRLWHHSLLHPDILNSVLSASALKLTIPLILLHLLSNL